MSFPDRDSLYMRETFGTNSLITDYVPEPTKNPHLEEAICKLKRLSNGELLDEVYQQTNTPNDPQFKNGVMITSKMIVNLLENVQ